MTTGPAHDRIFDHDPVMAALRAEGPVSGDPLGLGLHVDGRSRAIGPAGRDGTIVLVACPLARGRFGELMGLPEVTRHAADVASTINSWATHGRLVAIERSTGERLWGRPFGSLVAGTGFTAFGVALRLALRASRPNLTGSFTDPQSQIA
ncbi:MAG: hypothetical protein JF594_24500, partial [Rhizobium leguminosarum]|nr:hypothetical protein [Rhizobium leguminosarum]